MDKRNVDDGRPITIKEITATAVARSTAGTMGIEISATGSASHTPYFYALRPNKPSATITVSASIHAKGTWK